MNSTEFEASKNEALQSLNEIISNCDTSDITSTINAWSRFTESNFFNYFHKFDPRIVYPFFDNSDYEEYGDFELDLYGSEYINKAWNEKNKEGLGSSNAFLIAGVNGADELLFLSNDLSKGISVLNHDEVYLSKNLNETVQVNINYLNCSLVNMFQSLNERQDPRL